MISRKNFNYSYNIVPKLVFGFGCKTYQKNGQFHESFLGVCVVFGQCKDSWVFRIPDCITTANENCVGSFRESFGKKPKENPIPLQNYRKERVSFVYIPYFLFTSITIFSTEILSMYLQHLQKSIYKSPLLFLIAFELYRVFFHSLKKREKMQINISKVKFPPIYEKVYQRSYSQFFYIAQKNIFPNSITVSHLQQWFFDRLSIFTLPISDFGNKFHEKYS